MYNEKRDARTLNNIQNGLAGAKEDLAEQRRFEEGMKDWSPREKTGDDSNIVKMRRDIYGS